MGGFIGGTYESTPQHEIAGVQIPQPLLDHFSNGVYQPPTDDKIKLPLANEIKNCAEQIRSRLRISQEPKEVGGEAKEYDPKAVNELMKLCNMIERLERLQKIHEGLYQGEGVHQDSTNGDMIETTLQRLEDRKTAILEASPELQGPWNESEDIRRAVMECMSEDAALMALADTGAHEGLNDTTETDLRNFIDGLNHEDSKFLAAYAKAKGEPIIHSEIGRTQTLHKLTKLVLKVDPKSPKKLLEPGFELRLLGYRELTGLLEVLPMEELDKQARKVATARFFEVTKPAKEDKTLSLSKRLNEIAEVLSDTAQRLIKHIPKIPSKLANTFSLGTSLTKWKEDLKTLLDRYISLDIHPGYLNIENLDIEEWADKPTERANLLLSCAKAFRQYAKAYDLLIQNEGAVTDHVGKLYYEMIQEEADRTANTKNANASYEGEGTFPGGKSGLAL